MAVHAYIFKRGGAQSLPFCARSADLPKQLVEDPELKGRVRVLFKNLPLHRTFFSPWRIVREGGLDPVLRGLVFGQAKAVAPRSVMNDELREGSKSARKIL